MTETQWLTNTDPCKMLEFLSGKVSKRKMRLFACACCRRIWHLLADDRSREGVQVSEQYADGLVKMKQLYRAYMDSGDAHQAACDAHGWRSQVVWAASVVELATRLDTIMDWAAERTAHYCRTAVSSDNDSDPAHYAEQLAQVRILHDLLGNPFHPLLTINPSWLRWSDGIVVKIGQTIYGERRFEDMPLLADYLEDAGCDDEIMLAHFRSKGPHVRGCWVLDLLLGKE